MDVHDPPELSLLYVQQWLSENGHTEALQALEKSCGKLYDDTKLPKASQLLEVVWQHMDAQLASQLDDDELTRQEEAERLLRAGHNDYAQSLTASIEGVHSSNVICVKIVPGQDQLLTGAGDGQVRLIGFNGSVQWSMPAGSGAVLCLDLHPQYREGTHQVLAGSMDGTIHVLDLTSGKVLASAKAHSKYVVAAKWGGDGATVASGSQDQTVSVQRFELLGHQEGQISLVQQIPFLAAVQDLIFLPDGHTLTVALRGSNYLRLLDTANLQAPESKINMNEAGDDHVSFTARHLTTSPDGAYLLVCTDTARMLVMRTKDWSVLLSLFGLPTEQFHQPAAAWHRDGSYVYAAAAGAQVCVFHVGSGRLVAQLAGHKVNVRGLDYDPLRNLLATCSFDKTAKVHGQQQ